MADGRAEERDWSGEARAWLAEDPDPGTRDELEEILRSHDQAELRERFRSRLEFGTAGLRGVLGAGPNRMNRALVRQVTAGLARYLLDTLPEVARAGRGGGARRPPHVPGVRRGHRGACWPPRASPPICFPDVIPTPVTAFAVEALEAAAGVVVTASHNPPEYNGYKVYWDNGAQIIPPHDTGISAAIDAVESIAAMPVMPISTRPANAVCSAMFPTRWASAMWRRCWPCSGTRRRPAISRMVYTPMHGVGGRWVQRVFAAAGFARSHTGPRAGGARRRVSRPCAFPTPKEKGAMDLSLALARADGRGPGPGQRSRRRPAGGACPTAPGEATGR